MTLVRTTPRALRRGRRAAAKLLTEYRAVVDTPVTVEADAGPLYVGDLMRLYIAAKYAGGQHVERVYCGDDVLVIKIGREPNYRLVGES